MYSTLLALLLKIVTQLLGYEVLCKVIVALLEAWAKTTKTSLDEKVFLAIAQGLGVPSEVLKKLVEEADKKPVSEF